MLVLRINSIFRVKESCYIIAKLLSGKDIARVVERFG